MQWEDAGRKEINANDHKQWSTDANECRNYMTRRRVDHARPGPKRPGCSQLVEVILVEWAGELILIRIAISICYARFLC